MNDDDNSFDDEMAELIRLAKDLHKNIADDPEMELLSRTLSQTKLSDRRIHNIAQILFDRYGRRILVAFAILGVESLIANDDEAAMAYQRVLRAMAAIENTEPEPDEKLH